MPLQPVIRQHTVTPVNTPIRGTPTDSALDPPHLSAALASSTIHRVGGGFDTTQIAARMEMSRLRDNEQFRHMDDQSFNTTLMNHLAREHKIDPASGDTMALMDPRVRQSHFVNVYEQSYHQWEARTKSPPRQRSNSPVGGAAAGASSSFAAGGASAMAASSSSSILHGRGSSPVMRGRLRSAAGGANASRRSNSSMNVSQQRPNTTSAYGYRNSAPTNVKGLFVAFADSAIEEKLLNLSRQVETLEVEREADSYNHRNELAKHLGENYRLKQENDDLREKLAALEARHEKELREARILKEEYENRYRQQLDENGEMQRRMAAAEAEAQRLRDGDGARVFQLQSLQFQVQELQGSLRRAEFQAAESAKRARTVFDEKEVVRQKGEDMERERAELLKTIDIKEKIIVGLEKELGNAHDKLSSIAFFKESFSAAGRRSGSGVHSAGSPGRSVVAASATSAADDPSKSKLYQKYFGKIPSKQTGPGK